jgi:hypothetical protein
MNALAVVGLILLAAPAKIPVPSRPAAARVQAGQAGPAQKKAENAESMVLGRRYDFQVEVFERVERYREATQEVLQAEAGFRRGVLDGLERVRAGQDLLPAWQARVSELTGFVRDVQGAPDPVCRYVAEGRGGEPLLPAVRAVVDVLRSSRPGAPREATARGCSLGLLESDPEASRMCRLVVLGDPSVCRPEDQAACRLMLDPDPARAPRDVAPGLLFLYTWARAWRDGGYERCEGSGLPWLASMCRAARAGDASLCPPWSDWDRSSVQGKVTRDATELLRDRELLLESELVRPLNRLRLLVLTRFPATCTVYKQAGAHRQELMKHRLGGTGQPVSLTWLDLPEAVPPEVQVTAACRVEASRQ